VRPSNCSGADQGEDSRDCGEKLPHGHRAYRPGSFSGFGASRPVAGREVFNRPMLSHAEISDRLEIQQLTVDYSTAIDNRRFDDLDAVFTLDAYIDYRDLGGIDGQFPDVKKWLSEVLPPFPGYA